MVHVGKYAIHGAYEKTCVLTTLAILEELILIPVGIPESQDFLRLPNLWFLFVYRNSLSQWLTFKNFGWLHICVEIDFTLPETNIFEPKNGWLEYYFPIGEA